MAYDEGLAELIRGDLAAFEGVTERQMFGGLCFMLQGNMVGGIHAGGAMLRVGKSRQDAAHKVPGTGPMTFTGRPMGGMVTVSEDTMADDALRGQLMRLAIENAQSLPPK